MTQRVKYGQPFEGEVHVTDTSTRRLLVKAVLSLGAVFLTGAAVYGLVEKDFGYVAGVWGAVAPVYGGIAGYYFGSGRSSQK